MVQKEHIQLNDKGFVLTAQTPTAVVWPFMFPIYVIIMFFLVVVTMPKRWRGMLFYVLNYLKKKSTLLTNQK